MVFVVVLFLTKNKTFFTNTRPDGLVYNGNEKIQDLVNRDTDGDGVPDWEESLYGTDPTKKSTFDGIPDAVYIAKLSGQSPQNGEINLNIKGQENLTQTDQLSRELFSSVAALNQAGGIDQNAVDQLSNSLASKIQNGEARKMFVYSDVRVGKSDSVQAIKNYNTTLNNIYSKYPMKYTIGDVLQKFIIDQNNVDESVLPQFDPIIKQTNNIINDMSKMDVPPSLAYLHLDTLNKLEKVYENVTDIRQYSTDIVVAMSGISQYQTSADNLVSSTNNLASAIENRLK
ncbi:MAG: hypothetical protein KGL67_00495 [Patescibacteria group bacterium]|nr:hypothetical protein [Patescibacteria group bacterium]